jgi:hypothetical protein
MQSGTGCGFALVMKSDCPRGKVRDLRDRKSLNLDKSGMTASRLNAALVERRRYYRDSISLSLTTCLTLRVTICVYCLYTDARDFHTFAIR